MEELIAAPQMRTSRLEVYPALRRSRAGAAELPQDYQIKYFLNSFNFYFNPSLNKRKKYHIDFEDNVPLKE
jgi:hypothetical protein